jgi:MSHA biogenesis protein MshN
MSLINKMLQDLDARGGATAAGEQPDVKAVPAVERDRRPLVLGGAALGVVVLAAGGWFGWQYWTSHRTPPGPVPKVVDNRIPDRPRFQEPPTAIKPVAAPAPAEAAAHASAPAANMPAAAEAAASTAGAPSHADADIAPTASRASAKSRRAAHSAEGEGSETVAAAPARKAARAPAASADGVVLRELTPKQMSENSYRRALAALQEGRVSAAMADLDKAVELDPRNDAARQTYVSLLLENRRTDDAIRQLRLALGIDARQPGLAMVLARLQLEKGGPALDTLLKTLPYATNNADYQAFLAGVLQRDQRHAEAAEHYREALGLAPGNAVWWMGLGISLQADQHLPEAREAYKQARAGAGLTPELKSFVDKKIEQLSR